MAEDKKGFILYADQKNLFDQLPNEKAGELIKFIFSYVNDEDPSTDDLIINLAFTPIKQQFKRDLEKWEKTRKGRSKAGLASAEARKLKKQQASTNPTNVDSVQQTLTNPTVNDNVNVNVTVNDNVTDIIDIDNAPSVAPKALIDFTKLLAFINLKTKREGKNKFKVVNQTLKNKYKARLKDGYEKDSIIQAITNAVEDEYHKGCNYKYLTPEFFSRAEMIDKHAFKSNETNTDGISEDVFLQRWKDARLHYDKMPTNISKLIPEEKANFNSLRIDYKQIDFDKAIQGMFQQSTFPKTRLRPTHFLQREHFETYLTCFSTKEKLFENKNKNQVQRI